jgi:regulatory protein
MANLSADKSGFQKAKVKIAAYCAYQERCHSEVTQKLYSYGLYRDQVEELVAWLITENYLNEERFATTFAGSKFRLKQWGKLKIRRALELKNVSEYSIYKGLEEIDETSYHQTIRKLIELQHDKISDTNKYSLRHRIAKYLLGKGYEPEHIWEELRTIIPD